MYTYIARQPILDNEQNTVAYELLFRDGASNSFPSIDPNQATSQILTNNHLNMGIDKVTGDLPAYINFHDRTLINRFPAFLDPQKVVIEILEDVEVTPALIYACKKLKDKGYKLALDDHDLDPKWDAFFPFVDIVKIDVLQLNLIEISKFVRKVENYPLQLLAEKVETQQHYTQLKNLGFSLFQGYFFAKPEMVKQKKIATQKQNILDLVAQASQPKLDFDLISHIFAKDVGLSYKLLRFINSPAYAASKEISSLKHALVYLGELELKKFIALLAVANLSEGKAPELVKLSLARAKCCELIAELNSQVENPPKSFLTGMLSLIDGILDHSVAQVMEILPVHQDIKQALMEQNNYLADYLKMCVAMETGDWQQAEQLAEQMNIDKGKLLETQQQAMAWADDMLSQTH